MWEMTYVTSMGNDVFMWEIAEIFEKRLKYV